MAVFESDGDLGVFGLLRLLLLLAQTGVLGPVNHITPGDLVLTSAHQGQFDLVLYVFDMDGASGRHPAPEDDRNLAR